VVDRLSRVWTCPVCGAIRVAGDVRGHADPATSEPCPAGHTNPHPTKERPQ
jgi:hypothetical protein